MIEVDLYPVHNAGVVITRVAIAGSDTTPSGPP
jgi:hypothetical protein